MNFNSCPCPGASKTWNRLTQWGHNSFATAFLDSLPVPWVALSQFPELADRWLVLPFPSSDFSVGLGYLWLRSWPPIYTAWTTFGNRSILDDMGFALPIRERIFPKIRMPISKAKSKAFELICTRSMFQGCSKVACGKHLRRRLYILRASAHPSWRINVVMKKIWIFQS